MNSFAVTESDDPQNPIFHFSNFCPAPNAAIGLYRSLDRAEYCFLDPFNLDIVPIGSGA